MKPLKPVAGLA